MGLSSFNNVTALITGGASGIGFGLARALGRAGARIAIASTNSDRIERAVHSLAADGIRTLGCQLDVADLSQWRSAVGAVESELGPIEFLALNAGVAPPPATVADTPMSVWHWSLQVNLWGVIHGLHCCLPRMRAHGRPGHVLITSSIAAFNPQPTMGAYVAAKAAVVKIAEVLHSELCDTPVGVSLLAPAAVNTDIVATSMGHTPVGNDAGYAAISAILSKGLDPVVVAEFVLARIREGRFYILTHSEQRCDIGSRFSEILAAMDQSA
jgi:NAD(P)-dependent dehydrogenase (short-subunit alcohol dehydrogenase family)